MIVLIFLSGCSFTDKTGSAVKSVCNSPYFEYKTNECCLDTNANSICDKDESVSDPVVAEEEPAAVEVKEEVVVAKEGEGAPAATTGKAPVGKVEAGKEAAAPVAGKVPIKEEKKGKK